MVYYKSLLRVEELCGQATIDVSSMLKCSLIKFTHQSRNKTWKKSQTLKGNSHGSLCIIKTWVDVRHEYSEITQTKFTTIKYKTKIVVIEDGCKNGSEIIKHSERPQAL